MKNYNKIINFKLRLQQYTICYWLKYKTFMAFQGYILCINSCIFKTFFLVFYAIFLPPTAFRSCPPPPHLLIFFFFPRRIKIRRVGQNQKVTRVLFLSNNYFNFKGNCLVPGKHRRECSYWSNDK